MGRYSARVAWKNERHDEVSTLDPKLPTEPDCEVIIGGIISTVSRYSNDKDRWETSCFEFSYLSIRLDYKNTIKITAASSKYKVLRL
jgi:hypothetical protein